MMDINCITLYTFIWFLFVWNDCVRIETGILLENAALIGVCSSIYFSLRHELLQLTQDRHFSFSICKALQSNYFN